MVIYMDMSKKIIGLEQGLVDIDKYLKKPGLCECGNNYTYEGLGVYKCEHCGSVFKNEYATVRDFVDKYGTNYSILEIAEMTGVEKKLIDMFVKDGKFDRVEKQRVCIVCHQPIQSGMYCSRCALSQISNSMDENHRKKMSSGVMTGDMKGTMHINKIKK